MYDVSLAMFAFHPSMQMVFKACSEGIVDGFVRRVPSSKKRWVVASCSSTALFGWTRKMTSMLLALARGESKQKMKLGC